MEGAILREGQGAPGVSRASSGGPLRLLVVGLILLAAMAWYLVWRQAMVLSLQRGTIEELRQHIHQLEEHTRILIYLEREAPKLPRQGKRQLASLLRSQSRQYAFDWRLLAAIVEVESHFVVDAQSKKGALGLMQVLPSTAAEVSAALDLPYQGPHDLLDIRVNVLIGTAYLHTLHRRFGSLELALAAFRVGPTRLKAMRTRTRLPVRAPASGRAGRLYAQAVLSRYTRISEQPAQGALRQKYP